MTKPPSTRTKKAIPLRWIKAEKGSPCRSADRPYLGIHVMPQHDGFWVVDNRAKSEDGADMFGPYTSLANAKINARKRFRMMAV